uniref:Uncharacterized protein n=2 Tax=Oryza TaxID=4527 RepID=A0A0E0GKK0_ORYNI
MSLRYASRVLLRAAAQAMRAARQPAPAVAKPVPAAKPSAVAPGASQRQQARRLSGGVAEPAEKAAVAERMRRRRREKSENVMQLVCWGPS